MSNINIFIALLVVLFIIRTIKNIFYHVFIWQLKEYRLDRMVAHLKTPLGKKWLYGWLTILKWILLTINLLFVAGFNLSDELFILFYLLPEYVYLFEGTKNIYDLVTEKWKTPVLTYKTVVITSISSVLIAWVAYVGWNLDTEGYYFLIALLIADKITGPVITLLVLLLFLPKILYIKLMMTNAKRIINHMTNLKVIGITGSIGKTSTKEFAAAILSSKYQVVKTPESKNVDIAIANTILGQITPEDEIFIAEMGAYKKGEIKSICNMVHPAIGVITYIGTQHMELFKSQKNIIEAKYELIDALPPNGVAILNADNPFCVKMAEKARAKGLKTILFGTDNNADVIAQDIKVFKKSLECTVKLNNEKQKFNTRLLGIQNIPNLLSAISIASSVGMKLADISKAVKSIQPPPKTMQLTKTQNNTTLIDDTFNASIESLDAALDYMTLYTGEKILILTPLIELGDNAKSIHEDIATKCVKMCDKVFLTNQNYYKNIISGASRVPNGEKKIEFISAKNSLDHIKNVTTKDSIAVFEGKESARILHTLI